MTKLEEVLNRFQDRALISPSTNNVEYTAFKAALENLLKEEEKNTVKKILARLQKATTITLGELGGIRTDKEIFASKTIKFLLKLEKEYE